MTLYVPLAGTHGLDTDDPSRQWWFGDHPFQSYMRSNGFECIDGDDPFAWSTDLSSRAWLAGAHAFIWYLLAKVEHFRGKPLIILSHSFGINVAAYAALYGLKIDTLIAVTPPYRATLTREYAALRKQTTRFMTIHAKELDRMVIGGSLFDGEITPYPPEFDADIRDIAPGIGHSKILYEPEWFETWRKNGWLELLGSMDWGSHRSIRSLHREPPEFDMRLRPMISYRRSAAQFNAR
jgi:hypothetical protein